jgi:hypothetical protein
MEPRQPGSKNMPDFDHLNDRIINESPENGFLVIKTNLDPKDSTENNPYYHGKETKDAKQFKQYFEE